MSLQNGSVNLPDRDAKRLSIEANENLRWRVPEVWLQNHRIMPRPLSPPTIDGAWNEEPCPAAGLFAFGGVALSRTELVGHREVESLELKAHS